MTKPVLHDLLLSQFNPASSVGFDGVVEIDARTHSLVLQVSGGELTVLDPCAPCDMRVLFPDVETAVAVLGGTDNPIEHFMQGNFRADGYLIWVFRLLEMFRPPT